MDALDKAKQRSFQYWFEDGLNEIGTACMLLLLGLYFYLGVIAPQDGLLRTILDSSLVLVILGGAWLVGRSVKFFKEKITYPRTGYVVLAQKKKRTPVWLASGISALAGGFFAAILVQGNLMKWLPALTGIIFCMVLVLIAVRANLMRFFLLAAICLAIGIAVSLANFGISAGSSAVYTLSGLAILISGVCNLVKYLRQAPPTEEPSHE